MRTLVGRIVMTPEGPQYIRASGTAAQTRDLNADYFKGVAPSDLQHMNARDLYMVAERLHESIESGVGTAVERANAQEAYHEVVRERFRRRSTIR